MKRLQLRVGKPENDDDRQKGYGKTCPVTATVLLLSGRIKPFRGTAKSGSYLDKNRRVMDAASHKMPTNPHIAAWKGTRILMALLTPSLGGVHGGSVSNAGKSPAERRVSRSRFALEPQQSYSG